MEKGMKHNVQSFDHEAVPTQDRHIWNENNSSEQSMKEETEEVNIRKITNLQIIRSVCTSCVYLIVGWTKGQIGPAFLDIMMISGAEIADGSFFLSSHYAGTLIGSVLSGFIFANMNRYLLLCSTLALYSLAVAAIPWCSLYELMVAAFAFLGVLGGILIVASSAETVNIWGPTSRGRSYLMFNTLTSAVASVIAPLVTAPFLMTKTPFDKVNDHNSWNTTFSGQSKYVYPNSINNSHSDDTHLPFVNASSAGQGDSTLYIAYTISAILSMLTASMFLILFCQPRPDNVENINKGKLEFIGKRSIFIKRLQLLNIGVFAVTQSAIDFTFYGYLAFFCINFLGWSKTLGATVTSVAFFARLAGTFSGMFLVRYISSHHMLLITTVVSTVGFLCLTISAYVYFDIGIWISVSAIGVPFGLMWPNVINWINVNLIPFRNQMSGFLIGSAYLGALLAPMLLGYLMEEGSFLWFCYICCAESVVIVINAILMVFYTSSTSHNQ
ncbi:sodium-dependent glucose transporter 1A-like [Argopecten irradians]|uniref:sodium-dependent glucose transporter 1A-like n=1 Tax=Argopecten irradians TaxID=31199 RepID=UPI00371A686B